MLKAAAGCRRCVSQVGKSPSGHLFESLTTGCIVSEIDSPDLDPHTACSTRVEPPRSSDRERSNSAGVCAISDRGVWLGWRCTRSARCRHACCLPRSRAGGRTRGPSRHCSASSLQYAERPPPSVRTNEPCLSGRQGALRRLISFRRGEVTCRVRLGHPWRGLVRGRRRTALAGQPVAGATAPDE